jgi:hypothetical protein
MFLEAMGNQFRGLGVADGKTELHSIGISIQNPKPKIQNPPMPHTLDTSSLTDC